MQTQSSFVNTGAENFRVVKAKKRILIVDDDSTILATFALMFQSNKNDLEYVLADSVSTALEEYNKQKFDVIILDHNLPRAAGTTFIKKTNAPNVFYFSGGNIHPETVWPYKDNIISIFQKPDGGAVYKAVIEHIGIEYKPYKSKIKLATTTEEERCRDSCKTRRQKYLVQIKMSISMEKMA